jgi:hypothetical protein
MKLACLLSTALLGWCAVASAQDRADNALPPVQAPPALNEPGTAAAPNSVPANAPTVAPDPGAPVSKTVETPGLPADVQAAAEAAELPVITVRQQGSETVEEYRKRGQLYFVRVLSNEGPARFYVDNRASVPPNIMQQLSGPSGVVQPVYYKLAEWK